MLQETFERSEAVGQLAQKYGARLAQVYWTIGPYDLVAVAEAPDDESAFALELSMAGNVRTTAMRAYDREEMSGMVGAGSLSAGPGVEEPNDGVPDPVRQKPPRQNQ
ncbi:MAG TPA: GYD domain-containing protein [Rubrobacteraceae bacterium]|nr:GYD domain-containing protein [Rubrobacteraceae bacterium]